MTLLFVCGFGALGGVLRSLLKGLNAQPVRGLVLPWGTLAANLIGCLLLGLVAGRSGALPIGLGAGLAGAASTWSTFIGDLDGLATTSPRLAMGYTIATLGGGGAATVVAMAASGLV